MIVVLILQYYNIPLSIIVGGHGCMKPFDYMIGEVWSTVTANRQFFVTRTIIKHKINSRINL